MNHKKNVMKNWLSNLFIYHKEELPYNFQLAETQEEQSLENNTFLTDIQEVDLSKQEMQVVSSQINKNLEFMKFKYNSLINSDIIIRDFVVTANGKEYSAFLLYIDGMSNSDLINDFILKPLMIKNQDNLYLQEKNFIVTTSKEKKVHIKKVPKIDLSTYIYNCLIPQNSLKQESKLSNIISGVNSGNCALFVDTLSIAFNLDVKGFKQRSISQPNNEIVIKGPHEAFVESIRTNTSLIRRIVNNEDLVIENVSIGKISKTSCAICYIQSITNDDLVGEVRYRLNNLEVDSLVSSGELEQLIQDTNKYGIPKILSTERPDKVAKHLFSRKSSYLNKRKSLCSNYARHFNRFYQFS